MWASRRSGERASLLWKLMEKKGAGETDFDENLKEQVKNRTQERKDVWEAWAASPADARRVCRGKAEGGTEGSSTHCSLEEQDGGAPHTQEDAHVW